MMEGKKIRLLLVEDDKIDQMAFERFAKSEDLPYDYMVASSISEAKEALRSQVYDVVVSDYMLGDGTAFDIFDQTQGAPLIMVTGTGNEKVAVKAMKSGAYDYLIKDPDGNYLKTLPATVELALERKQTEKELRNYQEHLESMVKERTAELEKNRESLEETVKERTAQLQKTVNLMSDREIRMVGLKKAIKKLRAQLEEAGMMPVADDPIREG
ncbi:MAG: response regulator [Deltaproteobacteria bacterium]|nr:response regulator [Deltaproteobacteria bacterium]